MQQRLAAESRRTSSFLRRAILHPAAACQVAQNPVLPKSIPLCSGQKQNTDRPKTTVRIPGVSLSVAQRLGAVELGVRSPNVDIVPGEQLGARSDWLLWRDGDAMMYVRHAEALRIASSIADNSDTSQLRMAIRPISKVLLDPKIAAEELRLLGIALQGDGVVVISDASVSPCGRWLAYVADASGGAEERCIVVRDIKFRRLPALRLIAKENVGEACVWARDALLVFVSNQQVESVLVNDHAFENDCWSFTTVYSGLPGWTYDVALSRDNALLKIIARRRHQAHFFFGFLSELPRSSFWLARPEPRNGFGQGLGFPVYVEHLGGITGTTGLYVAVGTFPSAANFQRRESHSATVCPQIRVLRDADLDCTSMDDAEWKTVYQGSPASMIQFCECFDESIVISEIHDAKQSIKVIKLPALANSTSEGNICRNAVLPDTSVKFANMMPGTNLDPTAKACQLVFSSASQPEAQFDVDLNSAEVFFHDDSDPASDPLSYDVRWLHGHSAPTDEADVPYTIVKRADLSNTHDMPVLIHVYGASCLAVDRGFSPTNAFLLDQGWTIVFAHVRGGSERGYSWFASATREHKNRSIEDFAKICAKVAQSTHGGIFAAGESAGAIAVAGAANGGAELSGIILSMPFLDVDGILCPPLHKGGKTNLYFHDWHELGNPVMDERVRTTMRTYSPLLNVPSVQQQHHYPHVLIIAGTQDIRCPIEQSLAYIENVRNLRNRPEQALLLPLQTGHFVHASRAKDVARKVVAWLLRISHTIRS